MCSPRLVAPAILVIAIGSASALTAQDAPAATARRTTGPIHLDGRLTESDWESDPSIGPLTQCEPVEGCPASEATDVRVLFDDDFIYVGVVCHQTHPRGVISTQLTRDANLDVDDRITIVLQPALGFVPRAGIRTTNARFAFQVLHAGADRSRRLQFHAERLLAEPAAVRQRITRPRLPESLPMDSETGQRYVRRDQPRVGENIRRVVRRDLQPTSSKLQCTFRF